jgi:hypothetical protein
LEIKILMQEQRTHAYHIIAEDTQGRLRGGIIVAPNNELAWQKYKRIKAEQRIYFEDNKIISRNRAEIRNPQDWTEEEWTLEGMFNAVHNLVREGFAAKPKLA